MGVKNDVKKTAEELRKILQDRKNREWAKAEIRRKLGQGKDQLQKLEAKLRDPKTRKKLEKKAAEYRKKALALKVKFKAESKRAEAHIKKNPKQAVAVAAAAGLMVGALWAAFHRKK